MTTSNFSAQLPHYFYADQVKYQAIEALVVAVRGEHL